MVSSKADIIARLTREILPLQGYKPLQQVHIPSEGLDFIEEAFPQKRFPIAAIHEFICPQKEDEAATTGFIGGLLSNFLPLKAPAIWFGPSPIIFPPALKTFGLSPEQMIFISIQKEKDLLWAVEEALKCGGLSAVIGEISNLSFTASRRFQLAVEQSQVTGFILRPTSKPLQTTASIARWKISSIPSDAVDDLPGVGFPKWQVDLQKVRNGKTGSWQLEWANGKFRELKANRALIHEFKKKTG